MSFFAACLPIMRLLFYSPQVPLPKRNFWIRWLSRSVTNMFPSTSKLIVCGLSNWLAPEPLDPQHPTTHRKPAGPDATMRWFHESTMNRYPSPSSTTPVGLFSVIVPFDPLTTTVVASLSPRRNSWILLLSISATYRSKLFVTKIPRGLSSLSEVEPEQPVPATITVVLSGLLSEVLKTRCRSVSEQ